MHEDALPRLKTAMLEQSLPRSQTRHRQARAHREVDVARQRREVACLDRHILRQPAAAIRVREAEHPLSHRQPRRAIAESGDHSGQLLPGNRRRPVPAEAIGPGRGPRQLARGESRRMNLNDDLVYRRFRLGPLHQRHPGRSRGLVRHHNRLHPAPPCALIRPVADFLCLGRASTGFTDLPARRRVRPAARRSSLLGSGLRMDRSTVTCDSSFAE